MLKQIALGVVLFADLLVGSAWAEDSLCHDVMFDAGKAKIEALIAKGADVNAKCQENRTPLHYAAYGQKDVVELLLAKGANVNARSNDYRKTPLFNAVSGGNKDIIELLIAHGADVNNKGGYNESTPLDLAAQVNKKDSAVVLIAHHANVNSKAKYDRTPLHTAAENNSKDVAELLIAHGANINAKEINGDTPLDVAASYGKKDVAEVLIAHGANVNDAGNPLINASYSSFSGSKEVVELLLAKGAEVNTKTSRGETALHGTGYSGSKEVAELLLAKGSDVNAKDSNGQTPLHQAALFLRKEVAELLLAHGADINAKDEKGETPLTIARQKEVSDSKSVENKQAVIALLTGGTQKPANNSRDLLKQLLSQFSAENETLRKSIIELALKLQPPPAIPQEAEDAAGRAAYIFNKAKTEDDMLAAAKEFLRAIEAAPWVANYYYNLCTVLENTPHTPQALHACKLYLEPK